MKIAIIYVTSLILMIVLDYMWLGVIAKKFFRDRLGEIMREEFKWMSALMFYLIFIAGILVFAVYPSVENGGAVKAILLGSFLGIIAYGTYEFTNHAFLKKWPLSVMPADIVWGALVSAVVSGFSYYLTIYLG